MSERDVHCDIAEMQRLAACDRDGLFGRQTHFDGGLDGDRGADYRRLRLRRHRNDVRHMIEVAVTQEDHARPLYLFGGEAQRPVARLAIVIGVEQEHLPAVIDLVIRIGEPAEHRGLAGLGQERPPDRGRDQALAGIGVGGEDVDRRQKDRRRDAYRAKEQPGFFRNRPGPCFRGDERVLIRRSSILRLSPRKRGPSTLRICIHLVPPPRINSPIPRSS
jgi:hypothetical protein